MDDLLSRFLVCEFVSRIRVRGPVQAILVASFLIIAHDLRARLLEILTESDQGTVTAADTVHRLNFERLKFERPNFERPNFERLNFEGPNFERLNFEKDSTSKRTQLRTTHLRTTELRKGPNLECDSTSNFELRTSKNFRAYIYMFICENIIR